MLLFKSLYLLVCILLYTLLDILSLKNMFKDNNITFIDLSKSFRYDMYYKHDNHLNKDGHRILSLELYDILWG